MRTDIDYLINLMERYTTNPGINTSELGEQETSSETSSGESSGEGGSAKSTTWSDIVGSTLKRGPANPIKNEPMADRVSRSGPANQVSSKTKHSDIVKPTRGPANQLT